LPPEPKLSMLSVLRLLFKPQEADVEGRRAL